jgi:hypothetical protein
MRLRHLSAPLALAFIACNKAPAERYTALNCQGSSVASWLPDSTVAVCLPPGFVTRSPRRFARPRGDTVPEHWIAVSLVQDSAVPEVERWPLTLSSGNQCFADCTTAERVITSHDTVAGVPAYIERGLVSGGISGERDIPALVASLDARPAWTAVVQARTPDSLLRDSLFSALRTLRIYPRAARDR